MTIGKVTKKDSRLFARTYKFMKKNTDNLTLKDFAELIEFMSETNDGANHGVNDQQGGATRQANRPILGLGHFLNQRNQVRLNQARLNQVRLNNQGASAPAVRQRAAITYKRNDWPAPPEPEKKTDVSIEPIQPPGGRVKVEYIEK